MDWNFLSFTIKKSFNKEKVYCFWFQQSIKIVDDMHFKSTTSDKPIP